MLILFKQLLSTHDQLLTYVLTMDAQRMKKQFEDFSVSDVTSENNTNFNELFAIYLVEAM